MISAALARRGKSGPSPSSITERSLRVRWNALRELFDFCEDELANPSLNAGGVYVIYRRRDRLVVRIGQATRIRDRLRAHQADPNIVGFSDDALGVAWAWIPRARRCGVETYLARSLRPEIGERFPASDSVAVNLPPELLLDSVLATAS